MYALGYLMRLPVFLVGCVLLFAWDLVIVSPICLALFLVFFLWAATFGVLSAAFNNTPVYWDIRMHDVKAPLRGMRDSWGIFKDLGRWLDRGNAI